MSKAKELRTELTARILDIPDVELKKSRFSKAEAFFFGKREIAHFHSNSVVDLRLTKPVIRKLGLYDTEDKRVTIRSKSTEWAEVSFKSEKDFAFVVELFEAAVKANK